MHIGDMTLEYQVLRNNSYPITKNISYKISHYRQQKNNTIHV